MSGAEEQRTVIAKGQWVSFWDDGNVLELDSGGGRMTLWKPTELSQHTNGEFYVCEIDLNKNMTDRKNNMVIK